MTVKQKQNLLQFLGFYQGNIDGVFGSQSQSALNSFMKTYDVNEYEINEALQNAVFTWSESEEEAEESSSASGSWWDDIKYFKRDEFKCHCGGKTCSGFPYEMNETLIRIADKIREHFGRPITVSSGVRDSTHNANVGGVYNSKHLTGEAMDFCVQGISSATVDSYVANFPEIQYHYCIDGSFIHMNV